jgi:hypothetical protein
MFEPWAKSIDLTDALEEQERSTETLDPDRPICGKLLAKSNKRDRTGISMLHLVQHPEICIRKTFTSANDDNSEDGLRPNYLSVQNFKLMLILHTSPQVHRAVVLQ